MKRFKLRKFYLGFTTYTYLLYIEVIFRLFTNIDVFDISLLYILIFNLFLSLIIDITNRLGSITFNKIIYLLFLFLVSLYYSIDLCLYKLFGLFFDLSLINATGQVLSFTSVGISVIFENMIGIIFLMLPFLLFLIFNYTILIERNNWYSYIIKLIISIIVYGLFIFSLKIDDNVYNLYYKYNNIELNVRYFGVLHSSFIDIYRNIFGFQEVLEINENINREDTSTLVVYDYNNCDIDFDSLINNETDSNIKKMHEYFKSETGTLQNEYTGFFEDKNLILFMAESFNEIAVDESLTPTLYKLVNSGFKFNNFYTPTISSTIGGEFQELTGLVASNGFLNPWKSGENSFPFGIAISFKEMGYSTYAYHDHNYTFQNRNKYLASLGFTNYTGCRNGLEEKINCNIWPESDLEMINATVDDYINDDKFFTYYVTVSGHGDYGYSKNAMSKKNYASVKDLNYSEKAKSYLASQIELDKALESLIEKLDEAGKLDDTVIALVGDHYPYFLSLDEVNELATYEKDGVVEVNRSNFILWNSKMDTVLVDKVGSEIDVLPTIYNLFGVKYDSRLIIGKDILSTEPGLAIFGNRSWVSDKGTYFAQKGLFVPKENVNIEESYVTYMNNVVAGKITMSKNILVYDYYSKGEFKCVESQD